MVDGQADIAEDASQSSLGDVAVAVHRRGTEAAASGSYGDRKLSRNAELLDQADERRTEIFQRLFLGVALAVRSYTWTQLSVSTPHAVLVALDDDRHGNGAKLGHEGTIARQRGVPPLWRPLPIHHTTIVARLPLNQPADHNRAPRLSYPTVSVWSSSPGQGSVGRRSTTR